MASSKAVRKAEGRRTQDCIMIGWGGPHGRVVCFAQSTGLRVSLSSKWYLARYVSIIWPSDKLTIEFAITGHLSVSPQPVRDSAGMPSNLGP